MVSRDAFVSLAHGVSTENPAASATAFSSPAQYPSARPPHTVTAPSASDSVGSCTISSASTSRRMPSPSHVGHAPYGELNEKLRGASSSKEMPSYGQASFWLNVTTSSRSSA